MAGHNDYAGPARDAESFWARDDYTNALDCYTAASLAFLDTHPGKVADPNLLELKIGAARCLEHLGRLEECIKLDSEVLSEWEKLLKPTDENILLLRETLAANVSRQGNHEAASLLLQTNLKVLVSSKQDTGHQWISETKYSLAIELSSLGKYQQALVLLEETLGVMTAKHVPQEEQDMVRAKISMIQETIIKRTEKKAKSHGVSSTNVSNKSELKLPTPSKNQESEIGKETILAKNKTPSAISKKTPADTTLSAIVRLSQEPMSAKRASIPLGP
jgi:tetratricopeptide (TPR) repeat protein